MRARIVVSIALLGLSASACGNLLEPAAAVVDGEKITVASVDEAVDEYTSTDQFIGATEQGGDPDAARRQFEQSYLSQLIRRSVLQPVAEERGLEVTEEEIDARMDEIASDFPTQSALEEALKEQGLTIDQLRIIVGDQLLEDEVRNAIVGDLEPSRQEIADYYEDHRADYQVMEVQHILVDDPARAQRIATQLQSADPKDVEDLFDELAAKFSQDTSNAKDGGRLPPIAPGDTVPEFEQALNQLDVDEISDPVQTNFGFHVMWLRDRHVRNINVVSDDIVTKLAGAAQEEAWQEWLLTRYEEADVRVNPRYGEFNMTDLAVEDASSREVPGAEDLPEAPAPGEGGD